MKPSTRLISNWMKRGSVPKGQRNREIIHLIVFFKNLSTRGIFLFWLAGFCICGILGWTLSKDARLEVERRTANMTLAQTGENARLKARLSPWLTTGTVSEAAEWWSLDNNRLAAIFTVPYHGLFTPFVAFFEPDNQTISKVYPLSTSAAAAQQRLPKAAFSLWKTRLSNAATLLSANDPKPPKQPSNAP
jgi:hypothetical protein